MRAETTCLHISGVWLAFICVMAAYFQPPETSKHSNGVYQFQHSTLQWSGAGLEDQAQTGRKTFWLRKQLPVLGMANYDDVTRGVHPGL